MEKAIKRTQEIIKESTPVSDAERIENLKTEVNSLLMTRLPESTSIRDADILATVIYEMIVVPENFLNS